MKREKEEMEEEEEVEDDKCSARSNQICLHSSAILFFEFDSLMELFLEDIAPLYTIGVSHKSPSKFGRVHENGEA